jgi:uncharacterized membrane protein YbhN (UPF0104 family)
VKRLLPWAGVLVSGVFVWLSLRHVDLGRAGHALATADWWWVVPAVLLLVPGTWLRALRWQALFDPRTRPPFAPVLHAMLIGLLFNAILPARAGEAARILALWREAGTSRVETLATAVAERVYDVFALLVLLFCLEPFVPQVSWLGKAAVAAAGLAALIAATAFVLARWQEAPLLWLFRRVPLLRGERWDRGAANLVHGLASFRRPAIAARAFALTVASWLVLGATAWLLLYAFHFHLGYGAGLLATIASALVLVVPAAPGGVGQIEAAAIVALSVFGVDRSPALSYGIVLHAVNLLPYLAAGYLALQLHASAVRRRRGSEPLPANAPE